MSENGKIVAKHADLRKGIDYKVRCEAYDIQNKRGKVGHVVTLHGDEKTFEETFPPINK